MFGLRSTIVVEQVFTSNMKQQKELFILRTKNSPCSAFEILKLELEENLNVYAQVILRTN